MEKNYVTVTACITTARGVCRSVSESVLCKSVSGVLLESTAVSELAVLQLPPKVTSVNTSTLNCDVLIFLVAR